MQKAKTLDMAVGKWRGILLNFGFPDQFLGKKHSACPLCGGGVDRYRFVDWQGTGSYFCSQCGHGFGIDLLMKFKGWDFKTAAKQIDQIIGNVNQVEIKQERSESEKVAQIRKVLKECKAVSVGDPVHKYLKMRCGSDHIPKDVKFHPNLGHTEGGFHPAMVSIVRDLNGVGLSLHRTYLTESGEKAKVNQVKKFMAGKKLNGGAIRLFDVVECVGLAEGIETALSAAYRFKLPVWAASNSVLLEQWEPPSFIKKVVVFGDNDENYVGQAAAYSLAKRLSRENIKVEVKIPDKGDWCDVQSI